MGDEKIQVVIDGKPIDVAANVTVLQAARLAGVEIPTLCYHPDLPPTGSCRICLVEIEGTRNLAASCVTPVSAGMKITTHTPRVLAARKTNMELLLSNHPQDCLQCVRNRTCELQRLSERLGLRENRFTGEMTNYPADYSTESIVRDPNKCILCRRCVTTCDLVQEVCALGLINRGFASKVAPAGDQKLKDVACALCGQCINVCPVGAIYEKDHTHQVWRALNDTEKVVMVQTAPAIRVALGEEFGLPSGSSVTGKMVASLRKLGFKYVFDTDFAADLTIMEEATELIERLKNGGKLPLITSCSPGWIKFAEHFYPDLLENLSTCKSPHEMFGALAKAYYAEKQSFDPKNIYVVSIMPCVAKKFEATRPELSANGVPDVDAVLTTREFARMIREAGIDFANLPDEDFDQPLGISSGAGVIFGTTGGVMEAALRTAYVWVTGNDLPKIEFDAVRGSEGVREATIPLADLNLHVAVAHSLGQTRKLLDKIKNGEAEYHFIEIMACPGGCVGGGGQPYGTNQETRRKRAAALYSEDEAKTIRKSHENSAIKVIYDSYLGYPGSEKAHHLLHTHFHARERYSQTMNKMLK
jgi:NADP-reducing hydrogenase subunit HndD